MILDAIEGIFISSMFAFLALPNTVNRILDQKVDRDHVNASVEDPVHLRDVVDELTLIKKKFMFHKLPVTKKSILFPLEYNGSLEKAPSKIGAKQIKRE